MNKIWTSNNKYVYYFKTNNEKAIHTFINGLELFSLGGSWGGYESLVLPTDVTRTATEWKENNKCIRFHIGLENPDDLIADIQSGLKDLSN